MCANIITRDKEGNIVRQLMPCDYFEDRKQCHAPFCNQLKYIYWVFIASAEKKAQKMTNPADLCRECELPGRTRELERRLSEMAIEMIALVEENRVLRLREKEEAE